MVKINIAALMLLIALGCQFGQSSFLDKSNNKQHAKPLLVMTAGTGAGAPQAPNDNEHGKDDKHDDHHRALFGSGPNDDGHAKFGAPKPDAGMDVKPGAGAGAPQAPNDNEHGKDDKHDDHHRALFGSGPNDDGHAKFGASNSLRYLRVE